MESINDALALHRAGRSADAESLYLKILDADGNSYPALHLMGVLRLQQGHAADALPYLQRALSIQPNSPETLANYAIALEATGGYAEALAAFEKVTNLNPRDSRGWSNRGALLSKIHRNAQALVDLDHAVALDPRNSDAWMNRGATLMALSRAEEALECFDRVLHLRPGDLEARNARGLALRAMGQTGNSLAAFDLVLQEKPDHLRALINRATVLGAMRCHDQELQSYDRALAVQSDMAEVLVARAYCLRMYASDLAGAIADQEKAVAIQPDFPYARGDLVHMKMLAADWRGLSGQIAELNRGVHERKRLVNPYVYQGLSYTPADLLASAKIYTQDKYPPVPVPRRRSRRQGKFRLGYLCSDFRAQATMHLCAGLFEHHDRSRFEVIGFDNSPEDGSPMRRRVTAAFDNHVPIQTLSDRAAANLIAENEIDILVNLNGYFGSPRMGVCAHRPALLQVNYLGFPGTLGADYMDYILADEEVIPRGDEQFYSEKVVRLPNSYQINDSLRPRPAPGIRAMHGLEETAFVFCNFNSSYKITPDLFARWLRLLGSVRSSVLWLLENNPLVATNLRREAARAGIDPARLVFAPPLEISAHLSRLALGDLFLDSLPYNAHTTASDALWAGLPLITCRGRAFAGRVAASLLRAVGLSELVTDSLDEYESLARVLAKDRKLLQSYRDRLNRDPLRLPLFDTARTTRHVEMAYETMMARWKRGDLPESFSIAE